MRDGKRSPTDYLGDVQTALERYDALGPSVAALKVTTADGGPGRYVVLVWNLFGKWDCQRETLADSINGALDRGIIDRFGFDEAQWLELAGRAEARRIVRG